MISRLFPLVIVLALGAIPAYGQEPGQDENDCAPSPLMSRMPGCGAYECTRKEFDAMELVINKAGEMKSLEGAIDEVVFACPATGSPLQLLRNADAALRKAGYTIVFSGKHEADDFPAVTGQKGPQWLSVQTGMFNEFPTYRQTGVLVKAMAQEMSASAQAMSDAIAKSGKLDVYGITFATDRRRSHRPRSRC